MTQTAVDPRVSERDAVKLVSQPLAVEFGVVPLAVRGRELHVGSSDPRLTQGLAKALGDAYVVVATVMDAAAVQRRRAHVYAEQNIDWRQSEPYAVVKLTGGLARRHDVIPVAVRGNTLYCGMYHADDPELIEELRQATQMGDIVGKQMPLSTIKDRIAKAYPETESGLGSDATESAVRQLIGQLLLEGLRRRASDFQMEPRKNGCYVYASVDGALQLISDPLPRDAAERIARVILLESRANADQNLNVTHSGQLDWVLDGEKREIRFEVVPTQHGPSIVGRYGTKFESVASLEQRGMIPQQAERVRIMARMPGKATVISGPNGHGKTSLLQSILMETHDPERSYREAAQPVEADIPFISSSDVRPDDDRLTFRHLIRSYVRMNTGVGIVGEVRDPITNDAFFEGAGQGTTWMTCVHCYSAYDTVFQFVVLGANLVDVVRKTRSVTSCRLARRVCMKCETSAPVPQEIEHLVDRYRLLFNREPTPKLASGKECKACGGSGYSGRIGIFETLYFNDAVVAAFMRGAPPKEVVDSDPGFMSLAEDAAMKVLNGDTTVEYVSKVLPWTYGLDLLGKRIEAYGASARGV